MRGLVIAGVGGLGREVLAAVRSGALGSPDLPVVFLDDAPGAQRRVVDGVPVAGPLDRVTDFPDHGVVLCVGGPGDTTVKQAVHDRLALAPDSYARIVHPAASLSPGTDLGPGSIVLAGVVTTAPVRIGAHTTFMPQCVITHDDEIDDYAVFASGVRLGGGVRIGTAAYLGMGATVRQALQVGAHAVLGMGAVLLEDLPAGQTWAGCPARPLASS